MSQNRTSILSANQIFRVQKLSSFSILIHSKFACSDGLESEIEMAMPCAILSSRLGTGRKSPFQAANCTADPNRPKILVSQPWCNLHCTVMIGRLQRFLQRYHTDVDIMRFFRPKSESQVSVFFLNPIGPLNSVGILFNHLRCISGSVTLASLLELHGSQ